jgi:hypothetical protein
MTNFRSLGTVVILSTIFATPALAQPAIQEPGAYAFFHPNGDLGIGSEMAQPHSETYGSILAPNAMPSVSFHRRRSYASGRIRRHAQETEVGR